MARADDKGRNTWAETRAGILLVSEDPDSSPATRKSCRTEPVSVRVLT